MADEALRRLERAATEGEPLARVDERLAWARALRRAGREGDALDALGPCWRAPAVRAELASIPAWTHRGGPDGTAALDVEPLRAAPRLRWHLPDPTACAYARQDALLGGPLGLVTCRGRLAITVLEPETGAVHATTPVGTSHAEPGAPPCSLAGEVLFLHCDEHGEVRVVHAFTDQDLHQVPLALARDEVVVWDVPDPTRPPGPARPLRLPEGFRHDWPYGRTTQGHGLLVGLGALRRGQTRPSMWIGDSLHLGPAPGALYAWLSTNYVNAARHACLDRDTGAVRWQGQGSLAAWDRGGVVAEHVDALALLDPETGAARWRAEARLLALGPGAVVVDAPRDDDPPVGGRDEREVRVLDRATGRARASLGPLPTSAPVALARDVVYLAREGVLAAFGLDGAPLWRVPLEPLARELGLDPARAARVHALLPAPGRLYAKAHDGTVYCFAAAGGSGA